MSGDCLSVCSLCCCTLEDVLTASRNLRPPSKPCLIFFLSSLIQSSDVYSLCVREGGREGNYRCAAAAELAHPGESDDDDDDVASSASVN